MRADENTAAEVSETLEAYRLAWERRDLEGMVATLAPDADMTIIGTGGDERIVGLEDLRKQTERDWRQSDEATWQWQVRDISSAGPVAWTLIDGEIQARFASIRTAFPVRITTVLELRGDRWLIMQMHLSVPAAGQDVGESYPPD